MTNQPIKSKKNYELLMDRLIEMIKSNDLKPGDKLDSIEKLSTYFGVSRSVVREALSGLNVMGLVSIQQGEGTYIADFNPSTIAFPVTSALVMKTEDIKELIEVRKILEVGAVRLAASNRTEKDLVNMKTSLTKMARKDKLDETADYEFHAYIVSASKNKILTQLLNSISDLMIETIRDVHVLSSEADHHKLMKEHESIYEAIQNRQPDLAEKYMLEHLINVEKSLSVFLK